MSSKPLVSALTPTKNRLHLTQLAVKQFLQQTYAPREMVIVEDGESDMRPWLMYAAGLRNFASNVVDLALTGLALRRDVMTFKFSEGVTVKYVRAEGSTGAKLNLAAEVAEGEYLFRFDSDDWWHPTRIETQIEHFRMSGADLVGLSSMVFYEEGRPHGWAWAGISSDPLGASQAFRRDWFLANPAPDQSLSEDYACARAAWEQGKMFAASGMNGLMVARDHAENTGKRSLEWERESPKCESFLKVDLGDWYDATVRPWVDTPLERTPIERIPKINYAELEEKMQAYNVAARKRGFVRTGADAPQEDVSIRYKMLDGEHHFWVSQGQGLPEDDGVDLTIGDVERLFELYQRQNLRQPAAV